MLTATATQLSRWQRPKLRWQRSRYSLFARRLDILGAGIKFVCLLSWDRLFARNSSKRKRRRARWLVRTLLELGPTFIKIGQALSTRADLLPLEYIQVLGQLQDRVPEFAPEVAIAMVEAELGSPIYSLYQDFEVHPLACASLGQVHKAKLHTGEDVVVKVQRPGLEALFNLDFRIIHGLVRFCDRYLPWTKKYDLEAIYQEFFNLLYQEIDYINEGKNADRFSGNFADYPHIIAPEVYWRYTTKKVLTLEYLPGIKIDDRQTLEACGINSKEIIQLGICCYLKQLLQDGFFQSDPHPGNMAVSQDGNLIFYDFGTMVEVQSLTKDQMVKTFFAVLRKDTEEVVDTLTYMGLIETVNDMAPIRRLVEFILEKFREKPVDVKAFDELRGEIYLMFRQQPFRLPPQMTFIIKSLTTLDGIARNLDPEYNLVKASQPFIRSITLSQEKGNTLVELTRQARKFVQAKLQQPSTAQLIQQLESRLERGELELRVRSVASEKSLQRLNLGIKSLIYTCSAGFTLLAGSVLLLAQYQGGAIFLFVISGVSFFQLLRALIRLAIRERLDRLTE